MLLQTVFWKGDREMIRDIKKFNDFFEENNLPFLASEGKRGIKFFKIYQAEMLKPFGKRGGFSIGSGRVNQYLENNLGTSLKKIMEGAKMAIARKFREATKKGLHIEADGCVVNIYEGLINLSGKKVTTIEILPDDHYAGEPKWKLKGSIINQVIRGSK